MNSSYGKLLENVGKYTTCKITRMENIRNEWLNPMLKSVDHIGDKNVFEVVSQKRRTDDDKLAHVGLAVLHMSKLLLMQFVYFLEDVLIEGSYKILYLGKFFFLASYIFLSVFLRHGFCFPWSYAIRKCSG